MIAILSILGLAMAVYFIFRQARSEPQRFRPYYWAGMSCKIVAGIALGLLYTFYYSVGDTFEYFKDVRHLLDVFEQSKADYFAFVFQGKVPPALADVLHFYKDRSQLFVRLVSVIALFSFGNYWVAAVYMSLVSFAGCWYLVTQIRIQRQEGVLAALASFIFVPSFVFWGSGVVKESLSIGAITFLAGAFLKVYSRRKMSLVEWFLLILSLFVLWKLKYYWAALFLPSVLAAWLVHRLAAWNPGMQKREILIWAGLMAVMILAVSQLHPNFYISRISQVIVDNYFAFAEISQEPMIHYMNLQPHWTSLVINSPWAFFSSLFRPTLFEASTVFQGVIALENLFLVVLVLINFRNIPAFWRSEDRLLLISTLAFIIFLATFLALSTPNFGTLSRYRIAYLPFLFYLLLYHPSQRFRTVLKI